ncbi:MAG: amidophosphoribosyltransferase [Candidatus Micrarchaeia archaeon]
MGCEIREKCGVFGIFSKDQLVSQYIYHGLMALQHRGQESAGIAVFDGKEIRVHKGMGLVSSVFGAQELQYLYGHVGIGHTRYSTTGASDIQNAQPFVFRGPKIGMAVALNGNILNYPELKEELEKKGHIFTTTTDTEVIAHLLARETKSDYFSAFKKIMKKLDGSYSLVVLTDKGEIIAARDPKGFKPLCIGKTNSLSAVASESSALDALDIPFLREIKPGEVVILKEKIRAKRLVREKAYAHCMFEFVYFARPDTIFEGKTPLLVREELGRTLARLYKVKGDVVVPIPDSGRSAAIGFSEESGIPLSEGLIKNRYIWRTFIMPYQKNRESSVKLKLNPVKAVLKGKEVVVIDDSIVRGTTMKKIAKLLRDAGAKKIHLLITCPPIIAPCYMGIDFPSYEELIASGKTIEEIRKTIGVDTLNYMTIEGLVKSIGIDRKNLCMACLTGEYPTRKKPARGD